MFEMKYAVTVTGNDGQFLTGGNPLKMEFECNDEFFAHGVSHYGEDVEDLIDGLAEDVSGGVYYHIEEVMQEAEARGECGEKAWEDLHDDNGIYSQECGDEYWKISIDSFWNVTDGIALTCGQFVMPSLREELEAYLASQ